MAGLLLPLLLLVGGYIFYSRLGGKEMLDNALNEIKGIGGGGNGSSGSFQDLIDKAKSREGSWTDERGNNFNNQSDTNTQSNIGKSGSIIQKQSNVFYTIPRFGNL